MKDEERVMRAVIHNGNPGCGENVLCSNNGMG